MCHVCLQLQHSGFQYVASDVRDGHLSLLDDLLHLLLRLRLTLEDKVELASIVIFNLMSKQSHYLIYYNVVCSFQKNWWVIDEIC